MNEGLDDLLVGCDSPDPEGEPHRQRRRAILRRHPEIRALYGHDPRVGWITAAVVLGQLGIAATFASAARHGCLLASPWIITAAAWLVGAFAAKWCGVAIHEASHNLVLRGARANRWLAMLANVPVLAPSAMTFRRWHLGHHTFLGIRGRDNDLATRAEVRWLSGSPVLKLLWLTFYVFFGTLGRQFLRAPNRWELINWGTQLTAVALILFLLGPTAVAYLALSVFFGFGLHPVAGHFIHEHYLWSPRQETYSYYGPLNALTLNLGYHVEHHDFLGVPSARLPELHRLAREWYGHLASHDSWTKVMWHFVVTPHLGHGSRRLRAQAR